MSLEPRSIVFLEPNNNLSNITGAKVMPEAELHDRERRLVT
jgi:hypothetical protein